MVRVAVDLMEVMIMGTPPSKCLYCGIEAKKRFCGAAHKSLYYQERKMQRVNDAGPEVFIQQELDKPAPVVMKRQEIDVVKFLRLVNASGVLNMNTRNSRDVKYMNLKEGDLVEITVLVLRRKADETNY